MRQYIEHIEAKNNSMEIVTKNQKALLAELDNLIVRRFIYIKYIFKILSLLIYCTSSSLVQEYKFILLINVKTLLDMSETAKQVLTQGDLATRQGLDQAVKAASILGKALTAGNY